MMFRAAETVEPQGVGHPGGLLILSQHALVELNIARHRATAAAFLSGGRNGGSAHEQGLQWEPPVRVTGKNSGVQLDYDDALRNSMFHRYRTVCTITRYGA